MGNRQGRIGMTVAAAIASLVLVGWSASTAWHSVGRSKADTAISDAVQSGLVRCANHAVSGRAMVVAEWPTFANMSPTQRRRILLGAHRTLHGDEEAGAVEVLYGFDYFGTYRRDGDTIVWLDR